MIANNSAGADGGGVFCGETMGIRRCLIHGNEAGTSTSASGKGGGVYYRGDRYEAIANSVIVGNGAAVRETSGVFWEHDVNVLNSTIAGHSRYKVSAGISVAYPAETYGTYENVTNCVFYRNAYDVYGCRATYSGMDSSYHSEGEGNIHEQPKFRVYQTCRVESVGDYEYNSRMTKVLCTEPLGEQDSYRHMFAINVVGQPMEPIHLSAGNSGNVLLLYGIVSQDLAGKTLEITDFSLAEDSPCIDAGNNEAEYLPDEDKAGNFRIWRGRNEWRVDMGAYEYGSRRFEAAAIRLTAKPGDPRVMRLTWNSQNLPDRTYSVYLSPDLATWTLVGSNIPSQGETTSWVDPTADLFSSRFYRISSP